jgi:hypothetical protein
MTTYTVAFYEIDRAYGGPEEGGWWFDTGSFVRMSRTFKTEAAAYAYARRANALLRVIQRCGRDVSSVLYEGGQHAARVYDHLPPPFYPATRPCYE